jgi:type 1 glutamine amidotransferase
MVKPASRLTFALALLGCSPEESSPSPSPSAQDDASRESDAPALEANAPAPPLAADASEEVTDGAEGARFDAEANAGSLVDAVADSRPSPTGAYSVLVYSLTTGYRHASIPAGIDMIRALGAAHGFAVDIKGTASDANGSFAGNVPAPGDMAFFTPANLAHYAVIVFLSVTTAHGDMNSVVLDANGKAAFQQYIHSGGGFVGIHTATDCEFFWDWYHQMVGGTFTMHSVGPGSLRIEDANNPATRSLPNPWASTDEWYDFAANPRPFVHVLTAVLGSNFDGTPGPSGDHPNAWCKNFEGGRVFQTARGHFPAVYAEPAFQAHVLGGIQYAAGAVAADCSIAH